MNKADKKYHQDFDFKHYYKFVPPFWLTMVSLIKPMVGLGILYGVFLLLKTQEVANWVRDFVIIYLVAVFANLGRYHFSWHKGMMRTSAVVRLQTEYYRGDIAERRVNIKNYIEHKANRNIFICGTSGQGKSFLTRYLLDLFPNQKIIFNFKANDEYLKLGYPIVDMSKSLPNPFLKYEAFLNAFLITFPIENLGITAEQIPVFVRELARASGSWQEFEDNLRKKQAHTKDRIQQSALMFIANTMKSLVTDQAYVVEIGADNIVFDFSKLNPDAKTFYAEVILRSLWHEITIEEKRPNMLICVDEAHRLLKKFEKYESIYNEMSREIRAYGMLWTSTQNLSDMNEDIRNQFATQFTFNTNKLDDEQALRGTDEMLQWSVTSLGLHVFTDARYQWVHEVIPEFYLYYKPKDKERVYYQGVKRQGKGGSEGGGREGGADAAINYAQEIRDILATQPAYATQMGKLIAEKHGIDKDKAKLGVKTAVGKMLQNDEIDSMKMHDEQGQVIVIYYAKTANMSDLHKLMQGSVAAWLTKKDIKIMKEGKVGGRSTPDLETADFAVEIETGLKHGQEDLKTRLLKATKKTIIVVPNEDVLNKYKYLKNDKVDIVTIDKFEELVDKGV
jgi:hypothetical protein